MKKTMIAAAVLMALAGTAQADNTCNHGCNDGGSSGTPPVTATGGTGLGIGVGVSSSSSTSAATAQSTAQQEQGQGQSQSQAILGSGNSHQAQAQRVENSGNSSTANSNNSSLVSTQQVNFQQSDRPVSTALAPALTSGFDTCLGSFGVGAQGMPVGISFGSTKEENICVLIKLSKRAEHLHDLQLANALLCEDARWRAAKAAVGEKCPEGSVKVAEKDENPDPADRDLRPDWVRE